MVSVGFISFFLFRYIGDPVSMLASQSDTEEFREQLRQRLGLDDPFFVQFGRFIWNALRGDFGVSYSYKEPVAGLVMERLSASVELVLCSAVLAIALGIPLGVYTALRRDTFLSRLLQVVSLIGISVPPFLLGVVLILLFAVAFPLLPSFGRGVVTNLGWWSTGLLTASGIKSLVLPSLTLGLFQMTLIMRLVRAEMIEVMRTDFIRFARARGVPTRRLYFRHALKSTLIPVVTVTGIQIGSLVAFGVVTETVFQWPGLGLLLIQAVNAVDIPILAAYLMLVGLFFAMINLLVDLICVMLNPRLRTAA